MSILDFFKNFFGHGSSVQEPPPSRLKDDPKDGVRNSVWQSAGDEEGYRNDFRYPKGFRGLSNPHDMFQLFENQMKDMLERFFEFDHNFNQSYDFPNILPLPDMAPKEPLNEVLKPSYDLPNSKPITVGMDISAIQDGNLNKTESVDVLKPSYEISKSKIEKQDSDLDRIIDSGAVARHWSSSIKPRIQSFAKSSSVQTIRRPDGSIEHYRTVRDSEGNEETTITKQIGNKRHTVVTKKTKDGVETTTEDIVNMDDKDLKEFNDNWKQTQILTEEDNRNGFPWHLFFGPYSKL
jgi:hypothetical protein